MLLPLSLSLLLVTLYFGSIVFSLPTPTDADPEIHQNITLFGRDEPTTRGLSAQQIDILQTASQDLEIMFTEALKQNSQDDLFLRYFRGSHKKPAVSRARKVHGAIQNVLDTRYNGKASDTKAIYSKNHLIWQEASYSPRCNEAGVTASSDRSAKTITHCEHFNNLTDFDTIRTSNQNPRNQNPSKTAVLFHELMHQSEFFDTQRVRDLYYKSQACFEHRHDKGDQSPIFNADSYTWLAVDRTYRSFGQNMGFN